MTSGWSFPSICVGLLMETETKVRLGGEAEKGEKGGRRSIVGNGASRARATSDPVSTLFFVFTFNIQPTPSPSPLSYSRQISLEICPSHCGVLLFVSHHSSSQPGTATDFYWLLSPRAGIRVPPQISVLRRRCRLSRTGVHVTAQLCILIPTD